MLINAPHIHIVFNHVPIVVMPLALCLLLFGGRRRSNDLILAAYWLIVVSLLTGVISYFSGQIAKEQVEDLTDVSKTIIDRHESIAFYAFFLTGITGVFAIVGLVQRRMSDARGFLTLVGMAAAISTLALSVTGYYGGEVRHSEVRASDGASYDSSELPAPG